MQLKIHYLNSFLVKKKITKAYSNIFEIGLHGREASDGVVFMALISLNNRVHSSKDLMLVISYTIASSDALLY